MPWKILARASFDFEHPSIVMKRDDVHMSIAGQTVQVWFGADEPMRGRLLLVADVQGLRVEWQKGCTHEDIRSASSVLRSLGLRKPVIAQVLGPLHRELHGAVPRNGGRGRAA
jgi:hypothetical protein